MSKVTFEVEGIKITVEKEDQPMFGHRGGYRQEDHFYRRGYGRFGDDFARRPYYVSGNEHDDIRRPYETRFAPANVNQQYGKQSTGEPMFDESAFSALRATADKAAEFADKVNQGNDPYHHRRLQLDAMGADYDGLDDITARSKRPNQFICAMVGVDSVEADVLALAEDNRLDEQYELIGAYDKVKHAIATFIGKYIFSGEAVDLPFTQTDRGDYAVLLPVPYLSIDMLLYVDMVEVDGKHYVISINFDYQPDVEGDDDDTTPVEQSAKAFIVGSLRSYIKHRRSKRYQPIQEEASKQPEGQTDGNEGNNQPVGETPVTQQKDRF